MVKGRKTILFAGVAVVLTVVFFLLKFIFVTQYSREIPELSESSQVSAAVKEQISEALTNARRKPTSNHLGKLGMVYHSSASYPQAAQCYELAIERDPKEWIWNYYYGYLSMEMGESGIAVENFKKVTEKNPDIDFAWYYIGEEYKNLGQNELAEKSFSRLLNKNIPVKGSTRQDHFPLSAYAKFELSRMYFDTGRSGLAETKLKELIDDQYVFGPAYRLLGTIYNLKGNYDLGKKYTTRASDLVDFSPPVDTLVDKLALLSRSELYLLKKIGEAEKSVHSDWTLRLVDHGLKYIPDNKYLVSKAIKIYLWKNLNEQAIGIMNRHISYFGGDFNELRNTGLWFFQKGLYPQAEKYWSLALELKPEEVTVKQYLAKCFWATGSKQKALQVLNEILDSGTDPDVVADVTYLLLQFGEKEKALTVLSRLKQSAPSNPKVQKIKGEIAEENGDIGNALKLYDSSFRNNPKDIQTINKYGDLLLRQKMWKSYIQLYREALEQHPNNPEILSRLGEFLIDCPEPALKNVEEGKEYVERTFTYYDCPPDILISAGSHLAYAYAMLGNKQRAITTISQTINIGRRQNISASQQEKLENMYRGLQQIEN